MDIKAVLSGAIAADVAEVPFVAYVLSNPTSRAEATPADLIAWTDGRALIATGNPFGPISYGGRRYPVARCNNSYIFPGLGLGILASGARRVSDVMLMDAMFMAAARALAAYSSARGDPAAPLLPPLSESRRVSHAIALAVAAATQRDGLAEPREIEENRQLIDARMWKPRSLQLKRV
jgi:malate dehydrogenase (oxaloacetate-decarboxylating)